MNPDLFTCAQNPTNSANMYHQFEKRVAALVEPGVSVYCNVNLLYREGASRPYGVSMSYYTSTGESDHRTFRNWAYRNGTWKTLG